MISMVEKQSEMTGRHAQLAMLLQHKWQIEIDNVVDKVKMGVIPGRKRTKNNKWFRRNWYRTMMRDRKRRCVDGNLSENRMKKKMPFY